MSKKNIIILVIILVAIVVGMRLIVKGTKGAYKYDEFAQCLKDKGATFYGAFWCPHCQKQKKMFGSSASLLPYVECSTPDTKDQTQICKDEKITGYPTWAFADGSRLSGEIALETLAQKTGCTLPADTK